MHIVTSAASWEGTMPLIANRFKVYWPDLAICFSFLVTGLIADLVSCRSPALPGFWIHASPELYCLAVIFIGVRFGQGLGLACAALASALSIVPTRVCAENDIPWSLMTLFLAVGLIAGWIGKRTTSLTPVSGMIGRDTHRRNNGRSISEFGHLMPEVVDQFRTPIASIQGASFVLEDPDLSEEKRQEFGGILRKECQRLQLLVESLDFTHSRLSAERAANIHRLFDEVARESTQATGPRVVVANRAPRDLPLLGSEPELIKRALVILITEVMRGIPGRGDVALSAQSLQGEILLRIEASTGDTLHGGAMLARAFAKSDLALVRNIVEQNGGSLRFDSNTSNGASICIVLPV